MKDEWIKAICFTGAKSTRGKRKTAWRHWVKFLQFINFTSSPIFPSQLHICLWIIFLFKQDLAYRTVKAYMYSLKTEIMIRGGRNILEEFNAWFIHSTLKHYRRQLGSATIQYRRPLTTDMLPLLFNQLDLSDYDTRIYATMAVIGVYCLLRIGELCFVRYEGTSKFIRNRDVIFSKKGVMFKLFRTKTDKDKKGVNKYISKLQGVSPNPERLMYIARSSKVSSTHPDMPFFALKNGKAVTRYLFVKWLQDKLSQCFPDIDKKEWSGISLRKGGATSAIRAGVQGEVVQKLGNWASDAYKTYVDHTEIDVHSAQGKMATWAALR